MVNNNGNGPPHDDQPPEFIPPDDDGGDAARYGDDIADFIRHTVRSEVNQSMGEINGKFDQIGDALVQINAAIIELVRGKSPTQPENTPIQQQEPAPAAGKPRHARTITAPKNCWMRRFIVLLR